MRTTSTSRRARDFAASRPPKPPPTITIRGTLDARTPGSRKASVGSIVTECVDASTSGNLLLQPVGGATGSSSVPTGGNVPAPGVASGFGGPSCGGQFLLHIQRLAYDSPRSSTANAYKPSGVHTSRARRRQAALPSS